MALLKRCPSEVKNICVVCGNNFIAHRVAKFCSKRCSLINFRHKHRKGISVNTSSINAVFFRNMHSYSKAEVNLAYKAFVNWEPLLSVVDCHCKDNFVCYPHRLENLRLIYNPKLTQNI